LLTRAVPEHLREELLTKKHYTNLQLLYFTKTSEADCTKLKLSLTAHVGQLHGNARSRDTSATGSAEKRVSQPTID